MLGAFAEGRSSSKKTIGGNRGFLSWVSYGFLIHSPPIILPNAVTFLLNAPLLVMKLRYRESVRATKTGRG